MKLVGFCTPGCLYRRVHNFEGLLAQRCHRVTRKQCTGEKTDREFCSPGKLKGKHWKFSKENSVIQFPFVFNIRITRHCAQFSAKIIRGGSKGLKKRKGTKCSPTAASSLLLCLLLVHKILFYYCRKQDDPLGLTLCSSQWQDFAKSEDSFLVRVHVIGQFFCNELNKLRQCNIILQCYYPVMK